MAGRSAPAKTPAVLSRQDGGLSGCITSPKGLTSQHDSHISSAVACERWTRLDCGPIDQFAKPSRYPAITAQKLGTVVSIEPTARRVICCRRVWAVPTLLSSRARHRWRNEARCARAQAVQQRVRSCRRSGEYQRMLVVTRRNSTSAGNTARRNRAGDDQRSGASDDPCGDMHAGWTANNDHYR